MAANEHDQYSKRIDALGLAAPAVRALHGAGYTTLGQLAEVDKRELAKLHGIGPNALERIRQALVEARSVR